MEQQIKWTNGVHWSVKIWWDIFSTGSKVKYTRTTIPIPYAVRDGQTESRARSQISTLHGDHWLAGPMCAHQFLSKDTFTMDFERRSRKTDHLFCVEKSIRILGNVNLDQWRDRSSRSKSACDGNTCIALSSRLRKVPRGMHAHDLDACQDRRFLFPKFKLFLPS